VRKLEINSSRRVETGLCIPESSKSEVSGLGETGSWNTVSPNLESLDLDDLECLIQSLRA
jgi:hypothetical protein